MQKALRHRYMQIYHRTDLREEAGGKYCMHFINPLTLNHTERCSTAFYIKREININPLKRVLVCISEAAWLLFVFFYITV